MSQRPVRVRIGPSPTGEPHVGTAYIALFNLAFARKNGGQFVLRIEDTDRERSRPEWEAEIMSALRWLGLDWDEGPDVGGPCGPYRQSERQAIYKEHVDLLLARGEAYRCFCTKGRLDVLREEQRARKVNQGYDRFCRRLEPKEIEKQLAAGTPFVVRMKMPESGQTIVPDRLRGDVAFENAGIDDQVLMKSDGFPTYHLANVVDDHLMRISHVIRAEEWINSTPKHIVLYRGFGWDPPEFFHMPLLRNADKSKISKRKNPVSLLDYKERGFIPRAVLNYLAMLGWTMPDGREMFSFSEFVENFTWEKISLGGPTFDLEKLSWMNGKYYREKLDDEQLTDEIFATILTRERIRRLVPLMRERIDLAEQFIPMTEYFFSGEVKYELGELKPKSRGPHEEAQKTRTWKDLRGIFEKLGEELDRQADFSPPALEELLRKFSEREGWPSKELFMPLRVALTGRSATPPLFDTMSVLGRPRVRRRIRAAIDLMKKAPAE